MGGKGEAFFRIFQLCCFGSIVSIRFKYPGRIAPEPGQLMVNMYLLLLYITPYHSIFKPGEAHGLIGTDVFLCLGQQGFE